MEKDLRAFSLSSAKRVQFQQAEMEAEEGGGPPRQRGRPSQGWEADSSGCVQCRMSVQIPVPSESTAPALFVSGQPKLGTLQ